jgi:hypothetical protein
MAGGESCDLSASLIQDIQGGFSMSRTDETDSTSGRFLAIARGTALISIAAACMAPAITINIAHQVGQGGNMAIPYAAGSAFSVFLAGVSPLAMRRALSSRDWATAGVCAAVFAACLQFNLLSAVGVSSTGRAERTGAVTKATSAAISLQKTLDALTVDKDAFKGRVSGETSTTLTSEQAAMRIDRKWGASEQCTKATKPDTRAYCSDYEMKTAAIAAAVRVEAIDKEIRETRDKLDAANSSPNASVGQPADPQSATIATALQSVGVKMTIETITSVLNLELAVILEVISSFGPFVLSYVSGLDKVSGAVRPDRKTLSGAVPDSAKNKRLSGAVRRTVRKKPDSAPDTLSGQANPTENKGNKAVRKKPKNARKPLRLVALSGGAGQSPDSDAGQPDSRTVFDEKVRAMSEAGQSVRTMVEQLGTTKWQVEEAKKRVFSATSGSALK